MTRFPAGASLTTAARQERARKQAQDGDAARAEQKAHEDATDAKTERLRAMRLERDRADAVTRDAEAAEKAAKAPSKRASKAAPKAAKVIRRSIPVG